MIDVRELNIDVNKLIEYRFLVTRHPQILE